MEVATLEQIEPQPAQMPLAVAASTTAVAPISNENGNEKKPETPQICQAIKETHNNTNNDVQITTQAPSPALATEKVLITICNGDRKQKKAFMSLPNRKDVIEKAQKYGLVGTTIVLESNGCEICEDEVLIVFAKEKSLLMLLGPDEEYIPPPPIKRDSVYFAENNITSNANDSTLSNDETLSMTSVTPSASTSKSSTLFSDFEIPWHKVPANIMNLLNEKSSLGKRLNTLANMLVDELRERSEHIPMRTFRQVAQQAASKYPDSLLEKDREGQLIATTPQALISKMINRNNTLNRPLKRSSGSSNTFEIHIGNKKRKSSTNSNAASTNGEITEALNASLEIKKNILINYYRTNETMELDTIANYMKQCFPLQRAFFNNSEKIPDINAIKANWPYIFDREILYQHFELLMSIDPHKFTRTFNMEKPRIFKYFKNSKNKKLNTLEDSDANVVRGLAYHFNEDPDFIFKFFEHGTAPVLLEQANPTNAPWAALVKHEGSSNENLYTASIFIEGKVMANCSSEKYDLADIVVQLLCYYYTFNMMYPKEVTQTLEFIVIYLLKNVAEQYRSGGGGNAKKIATGNSKFNQLIAKLTATTTSNSNC